MMALPPDKSDEKPQEEQLKFLKVRCPKCKEMPGFPCKFLRIKNDMKVYEVDYWAIHIARVILYEVFALGSVNEYGVGGAVSKEKSN